MPSASLDASLTTSFSAEPRPRFWATWAERLPASAISWARPAAACWSATCAVADGPAGAAWATATGIAVTSMAVVAARAAMLTRACV